MTNSDWKPFADVYPSIAVTGQIVVWPQFYSPQFDNERGILVWLPPDYATSDRRYPVIYVHDAQNIYADALSFVGEWGFDETMTELAAEGLPAIIVGVENTGEGRNTEYSPFPWQRGPGLANDYLAFLTETLKPVIDTDFRTRTDPPNTGILGSSLGGLVSLYGVFKSAAFGLAGCFSPFFVPGDGEIFGTVRRMLTTDKRIYMDVGTREAYNMDVEEDAKGPFSALYLRGVREMDVMLRDHGFGPANYLYVEDQGAIHNELAWSKRLPEAMRFLLAKTR